MERKQIKEWGKNAFKANYWPCVAVAFIMSIVAGGSGGSLSFRFNGNSNEIDASEFRALMDNPDVGKMLMIMIPIIIYQLTQFKNPLLYLYFTHYLYFIIIKRFIK